MFALTLALATVGAPPDERWLDRPRLASEEFRLPGPYDPYDYEEDLVPVRGLRFGIGVELSLLRNGERVYRAPRRYYEVPVYVPREYYAPQRYSEPIPYRNGGGYQNGNGGYHRRSLEVYDEDGGRRNGIRFESTRDGYAAPRRYEAPRYEMPRYAPAPRYVPGPCPGGYCPRY